MNGLIVSYNRATGAGLIKVEDDSYEFSHNVWQDKRHPVIGDDVEFELQDDKVSAARLFVNLNNPLRPVKYRWVAGLLGLTLGMVGAHRFYLGFWKYGLAQIALTVVTGGYGLLWGFMEGILILAAQIDRDAKGRYLK